MNWMSGIPVAAVIALAAACANPKAAEDPAAAAGDAGLPPDTAAGGGTDALAADVAAGEVAGDVALDADPAADAVVVIDPPTENTRTLNVQLADPQAVAHLTVELAARRLTLHYSHGKSNVDAARTTLELDRLRLGRVATWDPEYNYSPENLQDSPPDALTWLHVTAGKWLPHTLEGYGTTGLSLQLSTADAAGTPGPEYKLTAEPAAPKGFRLRIAPLDAQWADQLAHDQVAKDAIVYVGLRNQVPVTERFYGLGEYFDTPQHRGKTRLMQFTTSGLDSAHNEAHVPIPLVIGTLGWGLFVEDRHPALFDVAHSKDTEIEALFATHALTFWLFAAPTPLEVTGLYTQVTGAPVLPAKWAFGTLIWRNENKDQAEVLADMQAIRDNDLAISGMWLDRPFDTFVNNFGFDPKKFPDPKAMVAAVHAKGLRLGEWSSPYTEKGAREHDKVVANDWYVHIADLLQAILKWGPPLDLTNPAVMEFWRGQIKLATDAGVEGWKLDYGQDIQLGFLGTRVHSTFFDGSDERTMHHGFQLFYHKPYALSLPTDGGWLLNRGGTYGDQVYSSIIWPGDLCANWAHFGECDKGGSPCHTGGLPCSVAAGISLPASGYPLFGPDTGGYRHGRADKELFLRWLGHSAFLGILQIGGSDQENPWDFSPHKGNEYNAGGVSQFDKEVLDTARYFIRLHTRLFPYIYSYAQAAHEHKPGLVRGLGLQLPELNDAPGIEEFERTEYFFGEDLLVAPFTQPGGNRKVLIPKGMWYDWWTRKPVNSSGTPAVIDVTLPVTQSPLYLRAGAIVPMLRPTIDTLAPVSEANIDTFHNNAGRLYITAAMGAENSRMLYDGTVLGLNWTPTNAIGAILSSQAGSVFKTDVEWELWGLTPDASPMVKAKNGAADVAMTLADDATWPKCSDCWRIEPLSRLVRVRVSLGTTVTLLGL